MSCWAIITGGVITNIVEAGKEFAAQQGWIPTDGAAIGDLWDGEKFSSAPRFAGLEIGKTELLAQVNAKRDELETLGFPYAGLWFQSDERSVARINSTALTASAALMAGQSPAFPDWLAADNTPLQVDAAGVLALQAALTAHAGALHQHARLLKDQVAAAQSVEDLAAIDISSGWPE